jgi:uncharacterized protein YabN with tetrapyrrole methylase and pyrophosphatase domain
VHALLWDVDTQVDFMLPEGKLYVPGAEETAPAMARLVAAAREAGFDAETALRSANERFAEHVARVEARATAEGRALESYDAAEMRRVWDETA